jgi:FMN-dependent NADH-azoreductase
MKREGDVHHRNRRDPRRPDQIAAFNFVEPYLRSVFGSLGVTDASFHTAGGTSVLNQGHDRHAFPAPHLQSVQTHAQTI